MCCLSFQFEQLQRIASASETAIRSLEYTVPWLLSALKYIFVESKNVIKNMSCSHSRDDVLRATHRVGRPCLPARSSWPSRTGGCPSAPSRSSALQICPGYFLLRLMLCQHHVVLQLHVRRNASLLPTALRTETGAPPRSSALHIWEVRDV